MRTIEVPDEVAAAFEAASSSRREAVLATMAGWLRSESPPLSDLLRLAESWRVPSRATPAEALENALAEVVAHRSGH